MGKIHTYSLNLQWTGNLGEGTSGYHSYSRDFEVQVDGKPVLVGSSDPAFSGDKSRYNPEEQFLSAIAACHLLWYLHLCSDAGLMVTSYTDTPLAKMEEKKDGSGSFQKVTLKPVIKIEDCTQKELAVKLHEKAGKNCFIANSCNFPIECEPVIEC